MGLGAYIVNYRKCRRAGGDDFIVQPVVLMEGVYFMDKNSLNRVIAENLKDARIGRGWSQSFVARQLDISQRTVSRAETGCGISKTLLKKLCTFYCIPLGNVYIEKGEQEKKVPAQVDLIPDDVAARLLWQSTFVGDIQREAVLRFNDAIQKNAVMFREDIEAILPDIISSKKSYSLADVISCCMAVNQWTVRNISKIAVA